MNRDARMNEILTELAAEPWAMEPTRLQSLFLRLAQLAPQLAAIAQIKIERPGPKLMVADGVATIPIHGILLKSVPDWMGFWGIDASSYGTIAALVREAVASPQVTAIRLDVDSPGGTVAGILEAARAIRTARDAKPVSAQVGDLAASAAYWLASQAQSITADLNAEIGSIGVYTVYYDASRMATNEGVTVHVIASGEHKGAGVFGAPLTESQLAAIRENINAIADNFISAVAEGRAMAAADVRALATGRLWEAKAAVPLKLIDMLAAPATAASLTTDSSMKGDQSMDKENQAAGVGVDVQKMRAEGQAAERAKLAEFKAAFPGDLDYAVTSFETGMSLEQAKAAYEVLQKRTRMASATGADGRIGSAEAEGNASPPGPDFLAAARAYKAEHRCTIVEAMQAVRRAQPELHEAFLTQARRRGRPLKGSVARVER